MLCTTALSAMVLSYVIPLYLVEFLIAVGQHWLGLGYSATISYWLGIFILLKLGGVSGCELYDAWRAENQKQGSSHEGEVADVAI